MLGTVRFGERYKLTNIDTQRLYTPDFEELQKSIRQKYNGQAQVFVSGQDVVVLTNGNDQHARDYSIVNDVAYGLVDTYKFSAVQQTINTHFAKDIPNTGEISLLPSNELWMPNEKKGTLA